ncbi:hypothetical protein ACWPKS_12900 [Coraliomargarita sp. W4R72]
MAFGCIGIGCFSYRRVIWSLVCCAGPLSAAKAAGPWLSGYAGIGCFSYRRLIWSLVCCAGPLSAAKAAVLGFSVTLGSVASATGV